MRRIEKALLSKMMEDGASEPAAAGGSGMGPAPSEHRRAVRRTGSTRNTRNTYVDDLLNNPTSCRNSKIERASARDSAREDSTREGHERAVGVAWPPADAKASEDEESSASAPKSGANGARKSKLLGVLNKREPRRQSLMGSGIGVDAAQAGGGGGMRTSRCSSAALSSTDALAPARLSCTRADDQTSWLTSTQAANHPSEASDEAVTREDQLRLMINADRNVEELLMRIRKSELLAINGADRESQWESAHPISSRLVLTPGSGFKMWWDVSMLSLVLISALSMPLDLAFDLGALSGGVTTFFVVLDVAFVLDFVLSFRIAYVSPQSGLLIRNPSLILRRWFLSWFVFDLVAAFPLASFESIFTAFLDETEASADSTRLVFTWMKLIRLMRLLKLPRLLNSNLLFRRIRSRLSHSYLQLFSGLSFLLYTCHFCGCIYIYIAKSEMQSLFERRLLLLLTPGGAGEAAAHPTTTNATSVLYDGFISAPQASWLPPASCYTVEGTGTDAALVLFSRRLYLFSIYWLMCSVSGTNVPAPFTAIEMAFSLAVVLGGFLVTAYVIGTFTGALSHLSAASNMEHQKRDFIEQFLRRKQIPKPLRRQVAQFFEFSGFDDEATDTLSELPVSLRLQLDLVINRDLFLKVPFFKNCETSFLIVMVPRIHREYTWWGKTVVVEELFATGLHMLGRGFCKCTRNGVLETLLTTNDFFGEESLLSDTPSPSTITTVTQCQFMVLDTTNFAEMLELYPNMQRALKRYDMMKAKTANKLSRERREWTEKSRQLHRVRLEKIRTGHTMPAEALARLRHEISNMAEMIKAEQQRAAAARRSSPAGGGHFFMSRARRSSHPDGRIAAAAAVAAVTSASSAGLSSTSASSAKQADAAQPTVSFRGDDGARRC